jgi:uroporphyrinogen decarboxylase
MSYIKKLIKLLKNDSETKNIPVILFARDPIFNSNVMTESGADCLSLYWRVQNLDLNFLSEKVALQGNLNPKILLEDKNTINKEVKKILAIFKDYPGYIFNLGHGITPDINPDNVKYLTELIRSI